jgi:hypothetical protein
MFRQGLICAAVCLAGAFGANSKADAAYRQYYTTWSYNTDANYYYRTYYYYTYADAPTYSYHYCVHYPATPRYVYYYNPVSRRYWGRFDTEAKGYSRLEEKDQKENIKDIPESAFPKPGEMPAIPDSKDNVKMEAPPTDLPSEKTPKDAPAGK